MTSFQSRFSRPPIGAVWGWAQTVAGRKATDSLLPGRALVISPHQDDETIGCGLLMAEKSRRGIPVAVVVATDGRAGWHASSTRPAPPDIAEIRRAEWHRALDALGVPRADRFELKFPDGELSDHEHELADQIRDLLRRVRPDQVFVTSSGDPHPDHRTLERVVARVVGPIEGSGSVVTREENARGSGLPAAVGRPLVFIYRVYPGEGLWPDGRPSRMTVRALLWRFARSVVGLADRRALLFRSSTAVAAKAAAIDTYQSQRKLLQGELHYVWKTDVELYWSVGGEGSPGAGSSIRPTS
jgi:LmbE family N-acetylglucosaminyl deacetylase